jgi:mRNA-degrading endonuclease toxin of MazEF toxin-antitoxin module
VKKVPYVSKKQQVTNLLNDIQSTITSHNVDIGISILKWTKEKIQLDTQEAIRKQRQQSDFKHNIPRVVHFGEIYGANLGRNIGSEQNGHSRPVLILQDLHYADSCPTIIIAPLTDAFDKNGNRKKISSTHVLIDHPKLTKKSILKLEHIRCISKNRLTDYMGNIKEMTNSSDVLNEIDRKLKFIFCIN